LTVNAGNNLVTVELIFQAGLSPISATTLQTSAWLLTNPVSICPHRANPPYALVQTSFMDGPMWANPSYAPVQTSFMGGPMQANPAYAPVETSFMDGPMLASPAYAPM